uniref:Uncharacterized protein n=1 Tax=Chromera velia CCMP2878 TaxID=1169474 RepID=A0A0G4FZI6_9ALVE|eukprot:Cvel_19508.t1-p1 / transcript=Cvel_19508.t1 / gene=Cvel_19508 / organism=Chromera_velia_CCMP2878 / gene_product=hypothetical protein / transcript_product=hypothetical protein / location=Cvel_scaffold1688:1617-2039(-) / protein_length=141 / sequence_SO=supercontig / SO=protein_coding / is_pseudo=false
MNGQQHQHPGPHAHQHKQQQVGQQEGQQANYEEQAAPPNSPLQQADDNVEMVTAAGEGAAAPLAPASARSGPASSIHASLQNLDPQVIQELQRQGVTFHFDENGQLVPVPREEQRVSRMQNNYTDLRDKPKVKLDLPAFSG